VRIGELAARTGVHVETIRYHERESILPKPARAANNYRSYTQARVRRLRFVRRARHLGFTLEESRALLSMIEGGCYTCTDVQALGDRHLGKIPAKIADLQRMEGALAKVVAQCCGERTPDCSMLEALFDGR